MRQEVELVFISKAQLVSHVFTKTLERLNDVNIKVLVCLSAINEILKSFEKELWKVIAYFGRLLTQRFKICRNYV